LQAQQIPATDKPPEENANQGSKKKTPHAGETQHSPQPVGRMGGCQQGPLQRRDHSQPRAKQPRPSHDPTLALRLERCGKAGQLQKQRGRLDSARQASAPTAPRGLSTGGTTHRPASKPVGKLLPVKRKTLASPHNAVSSPRGPRPNRFSPCANRKPPVPLPPVANATRRGDAAAREAAEGRGPPRQRRNYGEDMAARSAETILHELRGVLVSSLPPLVGWATCPTLAGRPSKAVCHGALRIPMELLPSPRPSLLRTRRGGVGRRRRALRISPLWRLRGVDRTALARGRAG
jgi:hypothetical protein